MNTRVSTALRLAAFGALAAGMMFAQTAPKGAYVLSEADSVSAAITTLSFAADGSVVGTRMVQQGGPALTYSVQGMFTVNADNSHTLTLSGSAVDAPDTAGDAAAFSRTLKLIAISADSFVTLSTDPGQYSRGELLPAGTLAAGEYVINGKAVDPAATAIEIVNVDASGNVSGRQVVNSFGTIQERKLSGAYAATGNGFVKIDVIASYTDENGDAHTATETYLAAATRKDVRMLQIDGSGVSILTMTK